MKEQHHMHRGERPSVSHSPFGRLVPGELYLFHRTDRRCPPESSLWGLSDRRIGSRIYLESSSRDLCGFRLWHRLPSGYRYCRLASRSELRDYIANLVCFECRGGL